MKPVQQAVAGIVLSICVLGLLTWGVVAWIGGTPSGTRVVAVNQPQTPNVSSVSTVSPPPVQPIVETDPDAVGTLESLKLPVASGIMSGPPKIQPDQPEPPLTAYQIVCPMVHGLTINRGHPDQGSKEIVGRSTEIYGLMQFDLSRLPEIPNKAVLRACVYYLENVSNYRTPLKLVFYRMKTEWDDSATFRHANARDERLWKNGDYFNAASPADVDLTPVGAIVVPNPPKSGFNVEVDITSLVAAWKSGQYPNHGILMHCDFKMGYSTQGNMATRKYTSRYMPQILCTVPTAIAAPPVQISVPERTSRTIWGILTEPTPTTRPTTRPASSLSSNP